MVLRVFVVEPYEALRDSLAMFVESLGHEVIAVEEPKGCPHYLMPDRACSQEEPCGDALVIGQNLPALKGSEFIARKVRGGCKGSVTNVAMICKPWSDGDRLCAKEFGYQTFETPLRLSELAAWLEQVAARTPPGRNLAPLDI